MTRDTLNRLSFICAHKVLAMEGQDSLAIPAKQYACAGKRRSVAVERIAAVISSVFEGCEQAELAHLMEHNLRPTSERLSAEVPAGESE